MNTPDQIPMEIEQPATPLEAVVRALLKVDVPLWDGTKPPRPGDVKKATRRARAALDTMSPAIVSETALTIAEAIEQHPDRPSPEVAADRKQWVAAIRTMAQSV